MKQTIRSILEYLKIIDSGSLSQAALESKDKTNIRLVDEMMAKSTLMATAQKVVPKREFVEASKNRIFNQLMELNRVHAPAKAARSRKRTYGSRLAASPVFSILLILILGFGFVGSVQAADQALPGDLLYFADTTIEEAHVLMALNDIARVHLRLDFADERLDEAQIKFGEGDTRNASIALAGFEKQMQEITIIVLNSKDAIKAQLGTMVADFHAANSEILISLASVLPSESAEMIQHALGASEHTVITISEIPEIEALDLEIVITLKFSADDPDIVKGGNGASGQQTPAEGGQSEPGGDDGYLPPGIIDNPGHGEGTLPPGLEDKKVPPGQQDKEKKN